VATVVPGRPVPLQNPSQCLTCGSRSYSRGSVVLVDRVTEYFPAPHRCAGRRDDRLVLAGWSLVAGLVGPVPVVMAGVLAEDRSKVPFVVDEHPVGALGSRGWYPTLGIAVRPWRPRWSPDNLDALAGEDLVEGAGELGVAVADEEAERGDLATEIYDVVAGLLCCPCAVRVGGHAEDVHAPVRDLDDERHVQAFEEDRVHVEEIAAQQAVGLGAEEGPPGGIDVARGWPSSGAQDPPHGGFADLVTEPDSSPWTRRYPQAGFSCASRSTSLRISWLVPGRPDRFGYVHLRVIRRRCQASDVPGVTSRCARHPAGRSRASLARTAWSAQSGLGRTT
jgi:hypothetical protein